MLNCEETISHIAILRVHNSIHTLKCVSTRMLYAIFWVNKYISTLHTVMYVRIHVALALSFINVTVEYECTN